MGCGASASATSKPVESDVLNFGKTAVLTSKGSVTQGYELKGKDLGEGGFGSVRKGVHRTTKAERAIKTIPKKTTALVTFKLEVGLMATLDHPNIARLYEVYEDRVCYYLVMELCTGGELFDAIVKAHHFSEKEAASVTNQIVQGIAYCHKMEIAHRDIKPENFLLQHPEPIKKCSIKIIDFGLAARIQPNVAFTDAKGTPSYIAPQVMSRCYDEKCDLWSIGVVLYILLSGSPPFYGQTDRDTLKKIKEGKYSFPPKRWKTVTDDAKDLIKRLLTINPKKRPSAEQALNHPWILQTATKAPDAPIQEEQLASLREFVQQNRLKKAALQIIAKNMTSPEISHLRDMFLALDKNHDGVVSYSELKKGVMQMGKEGAQVGLQQLLDGMDVDGSQGIDYTEFIASTLSKKVYEEADVCWAAFCTFDQDGDGAVSKHEIAKILKAPRVSECMGAASIDRVLKEVDLNGDGLIDFEEFLKMMRGTRPDTPDGISVIERGSGG